MKAYNLEFARKHKAQVTELYLHGLGMTGWPDSLFELPNLQVLGLSANRLTEVPERIDQLVHLRVLDLSDNLLSTLPKTLASLTKLRAVNLSANQFTRFPAVLGKIPALQKLDLGDNKLRTLPGHFPIVSQLQVLRLHKNRLRELPFAWELPVQLQDLHLDENHLSSLPDWLGNLPGLELLSLSHNRLEEFDLSPGQLTSLEALDLGHNKLGCLPASIGRLRHLRRLNLDRNAVHELPGSFEHLHALRRLSCRGNLMKEWPHQLAELPRLEFLDLGYNQLQQLPGAPGRWPALVELSLQGNALVDLPASIARLPHLKKIRLARNRFESFPESLVASLSLEEVSGAPGASRAIRFIQACQRVALPEKCRLALFSVWNGDRSPGQIKAAHLVSGFRLPLPSLQKLIRKYLIDRQNRDIEPNRSVVGFLGRMRLSKKNWKERLGATRVETTEAQGKMPTHVVLGTGSFVVPTEWLSLSITYLEEATLFQQLHTKDGAYLQKREDYGQLVRLLQSKQEASLRLALSLLKNGGVPAPLMTDLFLAWRNLSAPRLKKAFRNLLFLYASPSGRRFLERGASLQSIEKLREACANTEFDADRIWQSPSDA